MRLLTILFFFQLFIYPQSADSEQLRLDSLLSQWHQAAKQADAQNYFGFIKEGGIFMGTDATERWTKEEFIEWSRPYFNRESAWNIYATQRFIYLSDTETFAWFDEELVSDLGPARGSGVLIKENNEWKLLHYNLSLTIPNEIITEVKNLIEQSLQLE